MKDKRHLNPGKDIDNLDDQTAEPLPKFWDNEETIFVVPKSKSKAILVRLTQKGFRKFLCVQEGYRDWEDGDYKPGKLLTINKDCIIEFLDGLDKNRAKILEYMDPEKYKN